MKIGIDEHNRKYNLRKKIEAKIVNKLEQELF